MLHQYCNMAGIWELLLGWDRRVMSLPLSLWDGVRDDSQCCTLTLTHLIHLRGRNAASVGTVNNLDFKWSKSLTGLSRVTGEHALFVLPIFAHERGTRWHNYVDVWKWVAPFTGSKHLCYQDLIFLCFFFTSFLCLSFIINACNNRWQGHYNSQNVCQH